METGPRELSVFTFTKASDYRVWHDLRSHRDTPIELNEEAHLKTFNISHY